MHVLTAFKESRNICNCCGFASIKWIETDLPLSDTDKVNRESRFFAVNLSFFKGY